MKIFIISLVALFSMSLFASELKMAVVNVEKVQVFNSVPQLAGLLDIDGLLPGITGKYKSGDVVGYLNNRSEVQVLEEIVIEYKDEQSDSIFATVKGRWLKIKYESDQVIIMGYVYKGLDQAGSKQNLEFL